MDFYAILDQVIDLHRQRQRVTYRALQRQFDLADPEPLIASLYAIEPDFIALVKQRS